MSRSLLRSNRCGARSSEAVPQPHVDYTLLVVGVLVAAFGAWTYLCRPAGPRGLSAPGTSRQLDRRRCAAHRRLRSARCQRA